MNANYCGNLGLNPFKALLSFLNYNKRPLLWSQFNSENVLFTHKARIGIITALKIWKISSEDEILLPAYNCGSELDPFVWYGAKVIFYRVDSKAKIDVENIKNCVNKRTKVIYITHYFGWPQNIAEIVDLCKERGIYLFEDCALSLFSKSPIGLLGDAVIYSFPKTLPTPDGGALVLRIKDHNHKFKLQVTPIKIIIPELLRLNKSWLFNTIGKFPFWYFIQQILTKKRITDQHYNGRYFNKNMPNEYYFDEKIINYSISKASLRLLAEFDYENIIKTRRDNYIYLYNLIHDLPGILPLFDNLPDGVCPLRMPIVVNNRDKIHYFLRKRFISVERWWAGYHKDFSWQNYPEARRLKDNILTLPVHQGLDKKNIEYIAYCLKNASSLS